MANLGRSGEMVKSRRMMAEAQIEAERMQDIRLLLNHLFSREEVTIKFILDCLYDVGSVNLINQRFRSAPLNRLMKAIAVMSKPAFKIFALRWFKKNSPRLISNWLQTKVRFKTPATQPAVTVAQVIEAQSSTVPELERKQQQALEADRSLADRELADRELADRELADRELALENERRLALERDRQIQQLRYQVRWLTGILIGVILLWGGSLVLPNYTPGIGPANSQARSHP